MDDIKETKAEETLEEMAKRLKEPEEELRVIKPKTRAEEIAENKKLDEDIERMSKELPKFRGQIANEDINLTDQEWSDFNALRFEYVDGGGLVYENDKRLLLEMLEMGTIKKSEVKNVIIENQPVTFPSWFK